MMRFRYAIVSFAALVIVLAALDLFLTLSPWCYITLLVLLIVVITYGASQIGSQFFVAAKCRGDYSSKTVALTFDDGPIPGKTDRLLDLLLENEIKAAFFCIGSRIEEHPELVRRIVAEGHLIGNHSYYHRNLFALQKSKTIALELEMTDAIIMQATGTKPHYFRPPYGVTNPMVANAVNIAGHEVMGWSIRSLDTLAKNPTKLLNRILQRVKGGDIMLFHDHSEAMFVMLPELLEQLSNLGLKVERPDVLLTKKHT
jgi:peptidoglycan-N-acetylglucosamine deacetylase